MRHVLMFSGGIGSWFTGHVVNQSKTPITDLLFTDTIIEDDDLYRFVVEGAADLLKTSTSGIRVLLQRCASIPPLNHMPARKAHLEDLRIRAQDCIKGLHWIADGRTPWEIYRDTKFIGNPRVAKCSTILKQDMARTWLEKNHRAENVVVYLGIDKGERHRFYGRHGKPGAKHFWIPWRAKAPLCETDHVEKHAMIKQLEVCGIDPPRLYDMGFAHNNCGGFCVKGGAFALRQTAQGDAGSLCVS